MLCCSLSICKWWTFDAKGLYWICWNYHNTFNKKNHTSVHPMLHDNSFRYRFKIISIFCYKLAKIRECLHSNSMINTRVWIILLEQALFRRVETVWKNSTFDRFLDLSADSTFKMSDFHMKRASNILIVSSNNLRNTITIRHRWFSCDKAIGIIVDLLIENVVRQPPFTWGK